MKNDQWNIDALFEQARNEVPHISFEQSQEVFLTSVGSSVSAGFSFWKQFINLKNGLIMLGTGTIITLAVLAFQPSHPETAQNEIHEQKDFKLPLITEVIESNMKERKLKEVKAEEETRTSDAMELTEVDSKESVSQNTQQGVGFQSLASVEEVDTDKKVSFTISNETIIPRMNAIQHMADQAGVDLKYKMGGKSNSLKSISMKLKTANDDCTSKFQFSSNFEINIGWRENENGKAIELYNDIAANALNAFDEKGKAKVIGYLSDPDSLEGQVNIIEEAAPKGEEEDLNKIIHAINNLSTEEDLMRIQKDANEAGIEFSYSGKFKRNGIRNLHIKLQMNKGGEKKKSYYHFNGGNKSNFSFSITWREDENGKAVDFDGNESKCLIRKNPWE